MATAEELLAQMEENPEAYAEEAVCTIDPATRVITVPQSLQLFGVESDQEAVRIPFRCPKIVGDNIDLSALNLRINYQNAGGELDIYRITDMVVDGSDITFSWRLTRKVTAYKGTPTFAFCAKKPLADGTLKNEWNTTPNKECKVLEGLEAEEAIVSQNPDILESILTRLDTLEAGGGGTGTGVPGKQVELRNSGTAIQWRYTGDTTWTDLVQISDITGPPGKDGTDGKDGEPGTPGKDGENGTPGTDGITPHIGDNGNWYLGDEDTGKPSRGAPGKDGDPGEEGRGITSVTIKADGHLQINYSDDTNVDVGKVVGENGLDGASGVPVRQEMTASDTTVELQPNILYVFPEMAELTLTFATPADTTIANEYHVIFTSGATATTLTLPNTIKIPSGFTVEANKVYELSVLENSLTHQAWEATT